MDHEHHAPPSPADRFYEAFYSAALGGAVVALYFLMLDVFSGDPLFTPSLLGSVMVFGAEAETVQGFNLGAVAVFSLIHFASFGALGFVASWLVRALEERSAGGFATPAIALFVLIAGGFMGGAALFMPGVMTILGEGNVLLASGLTAVTMTMFLRHAHTTVERSEDSPHDARHSPA